MDSEQEAAWVAVLDFVAAVSVAVVRSSSVDSALVAVKNLQAAGRCFAAGVVATAEAEEQSQKGSLTVASSAMRKSVVRVRTDWPAVA